MNIGWISLRDLEYVVSVSEHLHFGKAAVACHVSQPALSSQIKKFEERLGFALFERTNRRVSVTDRGRIVIEQAREVLDAAQKLISDPDDADAADLRGTMRVGVIATLGPYYVPRFFPALKQDHPRAQFVLREGLTDGLLSELKSGALDVVLAAADTFDESGLAVFPLFEELFLLAVPRGHRLAVKKPLLPTDLRAEEMILLEDGHCLRDQALDVCPRNRRGNIRQFHATSLETLRHLVAAGMGYTLMPRLSIEQDDPMRKLLRYRNFDQKQIGRTIVLICRDRTPRRREFETLAHFLRKHAASLPALS